MEHVHTTLHVTGDAAALDVLARQVLGVPLARLASPDPPDDQGGARPSR